MENSEAEKDADTHENVNAQSEGARAIGGGKEERPKNCGSWKRELEKKSAVRFTCSLTPKLERKREDAIRDLRGIQARENPCQRENRPCCDIK